METRTSVRGILQNASGQSVKDAIVMITAGSHEFNDIAAVTNDSGEFSLSNIVVPGTYTLQIQGPNGSTTKQVSVSGGDTLRIRL